MASNEELAARLQQGDKEAAGRLWEQVRGWCWRVVSGYRTMAEDNRAIDLDDLMQGAFLGMLEAAQTFDGGKGSFTTWLTFYVRNQCHSALGLKGRERREHYAALSTDTALGDDLRLLDTLVDESLPEATEALEREDLAHDVRQAVDALPERQREIICRRYFQNQGFRQISECMSLPYSTTMADKNHAFRALGRDRILRKHYMPDYLRYGVSTFRTTWTSPTEAAVLWLERHGYRRDEH